MAKGVRSRKSVRVLWGQSTSEEESRAYLQARLTVLYKLMFWAFVALMAFLWVMYRRYPWIEPKHNEYVYVSFVVGLVAMAIVWRGGLLRRKLTFEQLHALDLFYLIGANTIIGGCALISHDFRPAAYVCLIYGCFTVLTRALIVPSTGKRTAVSTTLAIVPMTVAAAILPIVRQQEIPGPAFFVGFLQVVVVAILLSAAGSRIIYGLRREVSAAKQLGQYILERKIGEGGMGEVYLAHHLMLRRPTAIKLLLPDRNKPDDLERFEREVQLMSRLTHPNTVAVYDYGSTFGGVFYYAMEYLGGGIDLEQLVRRHGAQPAGRVAQILAQVCGALQEAHDRGLIHRDIKPANIILCERGGVADVAKVVDFGLVKELTAEGGASTQVILGTPAYLSPEAVTEPSAIGPPADLYAVGAVGYFLLTGRRVFEGKTAIDVCIQHATRAPTPPSEIAVNHVPAELEAVILRCLAKRPQDRYASASELAEALCAPAVSGGWDEAEAQRWWADFRSHEAKEAAASSTPTITMTVDFEAREGELETPAP